MNVAKLNEYAQRQRLELKYEDVGSVGPDHIKTFTLRAVLNGKAYPDGVGKNKKEAKQNAARNALTCLLEEPIDPTEHAKYSGTPSKSKEELNQNVLDICEKTKSLSLRTTGEVLTDTNYIGMINIYCQRTKLSHDYILEKQCGPPHNPQFFYKLLINNKEYPVGEGKSAKEAKQKAAQLALSALQEQTDWDSKVSFCPAVSEDSAPARLSTPPSTPNSHDAKSKSVPSSPRDSAVFSNSLNPPKDKIKSPDVKPKIKIAANFPNAYKNRKEDIMVNSNVNNKDNSQSEKTTNQSTISRFTSDFDFIVCLGKGAFGQVFKAEQKLIKKCYAIKIVRCKDIKKALREVMALSDLHHNNIVRYYTCWLQDSGYQWDKADDSGSTSQSTGSLSGKYLYIQMELCDTRTLRVWIDEKNIQNVKKSLRDSKRRDESLTIAQQMASAVEYIHSKMLIHRDLKPANIMFGLDGEVKIGDFGLVTDENDDDAENLLERSVYKGTPSYMAPEQKKKSTYDRKVDIFALGLIYFELLWNLSVGNERKVIWEDARNQQFPQGFLQNFPLETKIIKSMLCGKPEDRPEASKLKKDLEECTRTYTMFKDMRRNNRTV
ncbi:interferon-induced, double-stranded RNA-activated protein kinase isoform X2 [Etheostoma spectabile]|uniref:interferon-induced, double-stranded RNA-activated protein kinase isoform X2 n=1 Tax=Etheostoma spectabile TaxID=54343 RepID=UPI0013AE9634|nr:interferon-induced, double-stranded RNA-activated protein kinase-like isoform X2 [Etheostoma spectabile]